MYRQSKISQIHSFRHKVFFIFLWIILFLELNNDLKCFIHVDRALKQKFEGGYLPHHLQMYLNFKVMIQEYLTRIPQYYLGCIMNRLYFYETLGKKKEKPVKNILMEIIIVFITIAKFVVASVKVKNYHACLTPYFEMCLLEGLCIHLIRV